MLCAEGDTRDKCQEGLTCVRIAANAAVHYHTSANVLAGYLRMPLKSGDLTKRELAFVQTYVATGDRATAEKKAGYAPNGGYIVLQRPEVLARVAQEQAARITIEGAPLAVSTLFEIMRNTKSPAASRVQAAKIVLDRALPGAASGAEKELHEMTAAEIAAALAELDSRLINVTPAAPDPAQAPDILD